MDTQLDTISADVKEIKTLTGELVVNSAIHNTLLKEHERRSLALEAQLKPIEKHVAIVNTVAKFAGALIVAVAGSLVLHFLTS